VLQPLRWLLLLPPRPLLPCGVGSSRGRFLELWPAGAAARSVARPEGLLPPLPAMGEAIRVGSHSSDGRE